MAKQVVEKAKDHESDSVIESTSIGDSNLTHGGVSVNPSRVSMSNETSTDIHKIENSHIEEEIPSFEKLSLDQDTLDKKLGTRKSFGQKKSAESKSSNGISRSKYTVPQPFSLATERRASFSNCAHAEVTTSNGEKPTNTENKQSTNITKKAQGTSYLTPRKSSRSDSTAHPDDDSCSATSTTPSVRANRSKLTVATAPTFKSSERAEKRKDFYSKLEEKHQAVEAERLQNEARLREEQETALKELRKSMVFKANPVPSFYQEGPPPKVELKKVPPTRAKSPKLGRRKSFADAETANSPGGVCGRLHRHSLGSCKDTPKKLQSSPSTVKSRGSKSLKESSKRVVEKRTDQETTADHSVQT